MSHRDAGPAVVGDDALVLTDEELAALTPPDAPRPVPLDTADELPDGVRRAVLLSALRSLAARGLVASGARGGTVVAREPLAGVLTVRSAPAAIARFELDVTGERGEVVVCHLGGGGDAVVETRSPGGLHRLARRSVARVAAGLVRAVTEAGRLPTGDDGGGGGPPRPLDAPDVVAALADVRAVGRLVVRGHGDRQVALSLVVGAGGLWLVAPVAGAGEVGARRVGRDDAVGEVGALLSQWSVPQL